MSRSVATYRTTFPGGLASVSALRSVAELSLARGDGMLRLSSCQQLCMDLPVPIDESSPPSLELISNSNGKPTVPMSTAGVVDCSKGYDWLSLGAFQEVLDEVPRTRHFSLGVSDAGQSRLPTYMGDVTLVASDIPYYWQIAVRDRDSSVVYLPWALPSESTASFVRALDAAADTRGGLTWMTIEQVIREEYHHVVIPVDESPPDAPISEEALVGVQPMSSGNRSCVGFYPEWGKVPAQFVLEICLLAASEHIGMVALTPYRSILVPNIPTENAKQWRQLAGRFQLPLYPPEISTRCLVGDDEESQRLAQKVINVLTADRCHASGLSLSFMSPAHRGESMIRIERESGRLYRWTRLFPRYTLYGARYADRSGGELRKIRSGLSFLQLTDELKRIVANHNVGGVMLERSKDRIDTISAQPVMTCQRCGTQYDSEFGDPVGGIEANTAFDSLPEDWRCPVCESPASTYRLEQPAALARRK